MSESYPDLNTEFPQKIDTFTKFLDILVSDGALVSQYQSAVENNETAKARDILKKIPDVKRKMITAEDLNKFIDATIALERFYKSDIKPYANQKQNEWQTIVNQFTYIEPYNAGTKYKQNNYISYGVGSSNYLYIALDNPPVGTPPTNTSHWRQLTVLGKKGDPGIGVSFTGEWDASVNYAINNCVEYKGSLWNAIAPGLNQEPTPTSSYWEIVYDMKNTIYPVSRNKPIKQNDGDLWFKII